MCQTQNQIKFNWKSAQTADSMIHGAYIMAQTEWKISGYDLTCLQKKIHYRLKRLQSYWWQLFVGDNIIEPANDIGDRIIMLVIFSSCSPPIS